VSDNNDGYINSKKIYHGNSASSGRYQQRPQRKRKKDYILIAISALTTPMNLQEDKEG